MKEFPRTTVGGVSISRMLVGTNWFLGYSHTSAAKNKFIREFMNSRPGGGYPDGVPPGRGQRGDGHARADAHPGHRGRPGPHRPPAMHLILTPHFNILPGGPADNEPDVVFDRCKQLGARPSASRTSSIIDQMTDRMYRTIRGYDRYAAMIRQRGMIPGLSTHLPEAVIIADESGADVETYIQIYNAIGFLMTVEADWSMRVIQRAKKPVMTIKPFAAGRLLPRRPRLRLEHDPRPGHGHRRHDDARRGSARWSRSRWIP